MLTRLLWLSLWLLCCYAQFDFSKEFFGERDDKRYLVLLVHRLGLANRLRTIADWYAIARLSDRTLLVSWKPTEDCNVKFTDLYESGPPEFFLLAEPLPDGETGLRLIEEISVKHNVSHHILYDDQQMWAKPLTSFVLARDVVMSADQLVATQYDGILTLEDVPCQYYTYAHKAFLQALRPKQEYEDSVRQIFTTYFRDVNALPVGVHLRMHDPAQDWEIVPPRVGETEAQAFGVGAGVEEFVAVMRRIEAHFARLTPQREIATGVRFFVASNHLPSKTALLQHFPQAVSLTLAGEALRQDGGEGAFAQRSSFAGMEHAFLEFLLMARMALVVHTHSSTFALEAARQGDAAALGVWHGKHVLAYSPQASLPYCGQLQYAKAYMKNKRVVTIFEGTFDHRAVSVSLRFSMLIAHIYDVFC